MTLILDNVTTSQHPGKYSKRAPEPENGCHSVHHNADNGTFVPDIYGRPYQYGLGEDAAGDNLANNSTRQTTDRSELMATAVHC
jgi:hypothetical protein